MLPQTMSLSTSMTFAAVVVVVFIITSVESRHIIRRWIERPVDYGGARDDQGRSLQEALREETHMTYTDFSQHLTSVKDSTYHACFIVDEDPRFSLTDAEKAELVRTQEPDQVKTDEDFVKLMMKAGPNIASMCRYENIYWLISDRNVPPPFPPEISGRGKSGIQGQGSTDRASSHSDLETPPHWHNMASPRLEARLPPLTKAPPRILAPPPVDEYKAQLARSRVRQNKDNNHMEDKDTPTPDTPAQPQALRQQEPKQAPPSLFGLDTPFRGQMPHPLGQRIPEKAQY